MNILQTIVEEKRRELERLPPGSVTPRDLQSAVEIHGPRRNFAEALRRPKHGPVALIAEIKRASPSAGVICADFDPVRIAREYEAAGAACLSVLTDEKFFQGSLADLKAIREAVRLPLLRKDFIIDPRQIQEAIAGGADAILLIAAILSDDQLSQFLALAESAGLAALVEIHDEIGLDRAWVAGARLLGVNNRDLRTFRVDLATTERLADKLRRVGRAGQVILVAESGVHSRRDVERLARSGAQAVLVGEALMRQGNIRAKIAELLGVT
jgi:indole-3-glycerol phosphate synthase